jgi:phage terminase Nu1 subunit (DNA packaging protein)
MRCTINYLADLTGKDRRTIQKRLTDLKPSDDLTYPSKDALAAIYNPFALDAVQERAQLDRARRELVELQKAEKIGELIPAEKVSAHWNRQAGNVRAKLLNLPGRLAATIPCDNPVEVEKATRVLVHEALQELSDDGRPPN